MCNFKIKLMITYIIINIYIEVNILGYLVVYGERINTIYYRVIWHYHTSLTGYVCQIMYEEYYKFVKHFDNISICTLVPIYREIT